jgi:hypothetical protein
MDHKSRYIKFCIQEDTIPLFLHSDWMDAVCTETDWDVAIVENKEGTIVGVLPYQIKSKWGIKAYSTPLVTPNSGPWIRLDETKELYQKISAHNSILEKLIPQLEPSHYKYLKLSPTNLPGHPWYWAGYKLNTMYTYRLDISSPDTVLANCKNTIRTDIRNAENEIQIEEIGSSDEFYQSLTNQVGGHYQILTKRQIEKLFALQKQHSLFFKKAIKSGQTIGTALFAESLGDIYYLIGARQSEGTNLALTALIWNTIQEHAGPGKTFDFEGTMLKPVEPFFRRFGGIPTPYLNVIKMPRWMRFLK